MTKLNCRAGDLAIVVRSLTGQNLGKVVKCIKLLEAGDSVQSTFGRSVIFSEGDVNLGVSWVVDRPIGAAATPLFCMVPVCAFPDSCLRPLRDTDGEDEMLRIVGLPNEEVTHG